MRGKNPMKSLAPCLLCGAEAKETDRINSNVVTCTGCGVSVRQSEPGMGDADLRWNILHSAWAPCSPKLLESGVNCSTAPRLPGANGSGISHYHPLPAPLAADLYDLLARVTDKLEALSCAFRDELGESGEAEELELCDAAGALIDEARATLATQGAK